MKKGKTSRNAAVFAAGACSHPPEQLRSGATYPPGYVAAHQRRRLLIAAGETLLEHGYARLTARKIAAAARVSSASFYAQFQNVDECLLAAHQAAAKTLVATLDSVSVANRRASRLSHGRSWPDRVASAVEASLRLAAQHPGGAILLICHFPSAESGLNGAHFATVERLANLLHAGRDPHLVEPPPDLARGMVDASLSLVATRLLQRRPVEVGELAPTVTRMLLTPYLGPGRAAQTTPFGATPA